MLERLQLQVERRVVVDVTPRVERVRRVAERRKVGGASRGAGDLLHA